MAYPFAASSNSHESQIKVAQVNHLPIVADFARRLGLVEIVNRLVPVEMAVEPGVIVLGMVLDTLSGRSPLYHLESAFSDCDRAVLFGQEIPANTFSDDNVGRVMDRIFAAGTQRVFSTLSVAAMEQFALTAKHVHFDTTSVTVFGDYNRADNEQVPFNITQGYSKDKRPDLKQFVLLTNVEREGASGYDAEQILRTYKEQYAIERNFSFLKDDQIVNALFLKRPERIEVLGLILLISLLIWRLIEHVMRSQLQADETTVPGWDNKPTSRPSAYMLTWKFRGVMILCIGKTRRLAQPLSETQAAFLAVLKIPQERFIHPSTSG